MRWWILMAFGLGLAAAGCRDEENPSPLLNEGVTVGDSGRALLPTIVPSMKDHATILGAAASAEEVGAVLAAQAEESAANAVRIDIDATTPEGLMKGVVAIFESGNLAQWPDVLVPEQQATAREIVKVSLPFVQAMKQLEKRWKEKFPDTPLQGISTQAPGADLAQMGKLVGVESLGDTEAEATIESPDGSKTTRVTLKKIDNVWRMQATDMPTEQDFEKMKGMLGVFDQMTKAMQELAQKIADGDFASAQEAQDAINQMGKPAEGTSEMPAENAAPETLQPAPPPKPAPSNADRPKSQLEQDMDNAAGRSAMGGI